MTNIRVIWVINFLLFCVLVLMAQDECSPAFTVDCKKKPTASYIAYPTRTVCNLPDFDESATPVATNIYGSRTDKRTTATGFYHSKQIDGRWWIVDPEGYLAICKGVTTITRGSGNTSTTQFNKKFGNTTTWINQTKDLLFEHGFYCAGGSSSIDDIKSNPNQSAKPLACTMVLHWMRGYGKGRTTVQPGHAGYPEDAIFVFEKGFAAYCEKEAQILAIDKNDKNIFGYFTDNELPFYNNSLNNYLRLGKKSPKDENYLATVKWLSDNGYTHADTAKTEIQMKFLGYVAETYFSITNNALKKYAPNHMNLGSRINISEARNNKYFMQAAGKYVDILAVNYYGIWTPDIVENSTWGKDLGKPFMVSEFYTKGDNIPGLTNTTGAGWIVKNQTDRGYAYQNYTLALLENKYCVGWHWLRYMDNDPTIPNPEPSNIDSNKGIVNTAYEPYTDLLSKMKELNHRAYNIIDYFDQPRIKIYPQADAYFKGNENHGIDERLGIKFTPDFNTHREAFLRFDLTSVSDKEYNASLKLFHINNGDDNVTYKAEFVNDDSWTESSITKANHPSGDFEIGRWSHNADLTLNVQQAFSTSLQTDKKLSIKISGLTSSIAALEYGSRENSNEFLRPYLELTEKTTSLARNEKQELNFSISPNPVNEKSSISITFSQSSALNSILTISDLSGKVFFKRKISSVNTTLDLSGISTGIYLLTLSGNSGFSTQKLVVF